MYLNINYSIGAGKEYSTIDYDFSIGSGNGLNFGVSFLDDFDSENEGNGSGIGDRNPNYEMYGNGIAVICLYGNTDGTGSPDTNEGTQTVGLSCI